MADDPRAAIDRLSHYWALQEEETLTALGTSLTGLTDHEVARRRAAEGVPKPTRSTELSLVVRQFRSPIIALLAVSALLSMVFADVIEALVTLAIILLSGGLGFLQERGAVRAVDALREAVRTEVQVRRGGSVRSVRGSEVIPGDIVVLTVGTLVPADCRVVESISLMVDESVLTGEGRPRLKTTVAVRADTVATERASVVHMGSHVSGGSGVAVVVRTGSDTFYGELAAHASGPHLPTRFEQGVSRYGMLLVRATTVLVSGVFVANVALGRPLVESFLFSLALAVGLTPQMLPAIVTFSLSVGVRLLSRKRVLVKRLDSIEDLGSLSVLCTDKTGTLTTGRVEFMDGCDPVGRHDPEVTHWGRLNARLQRSFDNPMDSALLSTVEAGHTPLLIGEVPFDFVRKMETVIIDVDGPLVITKGAVHSVIGRCNRVWTAEGAVGIGLHRAAIEESAALLSRDGLRVLALALGRPGVANDPGSMPFLDVESDLVFRGFLVFEDPVKPDAKTAVQTLRSLGIRVVLVTGDSAVSAMHAARGVGLEADKVLTGIDIAVLDGRSLTVALSDVSIVADVDPLQKQRVVEALRSGGMSVGFLGDGVNDVAAIHAADVGISVDSAVDAARSTADLVLMDKDLGVLSAGVAEGRKVFRNTLKYVHVTTSANFGNMVSLAAAAMFLPFLPLLPLQVLLLNFLSDIPGMTVATDRVDPEQLESPSGWEIAGLRRFMVAFGLVSTCADLATFVLLRNVLTLGPAELRSGWFLESVITELAALLALRTSRPLWRSAPSPALWVSSTLVATATFALVQSSAGSVFGFTVLDGATIGGLLLIGAAYVAATEAVKSRWRSLLDGGVRAPVVDRA